MIATATVIMQN